MYLVLLEELVGRHLRTNPLDKYGVLLAYSPVVQKLAKMSHTVHSYKTAKTMQEPSLLNPRAFLTCPEQEEL